MSNATVLIPDRLGAPSVESAVLGPDVRLVTPQAARAEEIPDDVWSAADAIILWHDVVLTRQVIEKLARCRVVVRCGAGFDNVDLRAAGERGIPVCNVPDYGTNDVADHTLALLISLWRGLPAISDAARESVAGWSWDTAEPLTRITGKTLGIIGLGRIGTATALRARAFGLRVVFYDPYLPDGYDKALGVERRFSLDEMLPELDAVTFHAPLTDETRGMADADFFARLRPGCILVNTARGPIVPLDAMHEALKSGRLRAAGVDVLDREPPDEEHALIRAWRANERWLAGRFVVTPHVAFYSIEAYEEMRRKAAQTVRLSLDGQPLRNVVNAAWLKR